MSRRYPPVHHYDGNSYQLTNVPIHQHHNQHQYKRNNAPSETILSDDTLTDSCYYDYYGYSQQFSDGSVTSSRLPQHYEDIDEDICNRFSRHTISDKSIRKSLRKVHPGPTVFYHDAQISPPSPPLPLSSTDVPVTIIDPPQQPPPPPSSVPVSHLRRPQSSMSSGVTSAIVDGCGGKCRTFENICYFFLQLIFMMGILIGISLSIAGLVLRKSAARNLQVLVYIGVLLATVSGILLAIQWNARLHAKKRKLAIRLANKRTPPIIPMENLNLRHQQQPLVQQQTAPVILTLNNPHQGVPWWRRQELANI